jgi:hypothetical protein
MNEAQNERNKEARRQATARWRKKHPEKYKILRDLNYHRCHVFKYCKVCGGRPLISENIPLCEKHRDYIYLWQNQDNTPERKQYKRFGTNIPKTKEGGNMEYEETVQKQKDLEDMKNNFPRFNTEEVPEDKKEAASEMNEIMSPKTTSASELKRIEIGYLDEKLRRVVEKARGRWTPVLKREYAKYWARKRKLIETPQERYARKRKARNYYKKHKQKISIQKKENYNKTKKRVIKGTIVMPQIPQTLFLKKGSRKAKHYKQGFVDGFEKGLRYGMGLV